MEISRRGLFRSASIAGAGFVLDAALGRAAAARSTALQEPSTPLPPAFDKLKPIRDRVHPITAQEFQGRVARAQQLMSESKPQFSALYVTPGTSMYYFTGIRWGLSERLLAVVIPRQGDPLIVCPGFEEGRLRESLRWPMEVRVWQEDESPYGVAAQWLTEKNIRTGTAGVEETTKYVFFDGLRRAAPSLDFVSGDPITHACRSVKSAHELELMRLACAATFDVYRALFASLREGMTQYDASDLLSRGFERMGLHGDGLVLFGQWAALPHGTRQPQKLQEGEIVLIDGGTTVEGYQSDVTRCSLLGKPSEKLQRTFDCLRKSQDAALAAAVAGRPSGSVDDAARKVVVDAGFGAGYNVFTHRLGHGIGLDGHEWPYLVRGSTTVLKSGMTFSNEPGIYIRGDYGMRLEDDMVIAESGAAHLLTPSFSPSLENPVG
jgi:Xaa-Pro dipeptidase